MFENKDTIVQNEILSEREVIEKLKDIRNYIKEELKGYNLEINISTNLECAEIEAAVLKEYDTYMCISYSGINGGGIIIEDYASKSSINNCTKTKKT